MNNTTDVTVVMSRAEAQALLAHLIKNKEPDNFKRLSLLKIAYWIHAALAFDSAGSA